MITNRKIKIVHVLPMIFSGGAERLVVDILKKINKEQFDVSLLCFRCGDNEVNLWREELKLADISVAYINKDGERFSNIFSKLNILFRLFAFFKKTKPDIVHTHLLGPDFLGRIAARLAGVEKVLNTEHNFVDVYKRSEIFFRKFSSYFSDSIIAVSGAVRDNLLKNNVCKKDKVVVIHNGIDISCVNSYIKNYSIKSGIVIGAIGRLTYQKGFDYLIDALALLPGLKYKCLIAGDSDPVSTLKDGLMRKIKNHNLEENIKLIGFQEDPIEFFKKVDIFCMPSRWEGFSLALLSAGACALPIIASDIKSIKEVLVNDHDACLFKSGDVNDLSNKISDLSSNLEKRKSIGKNMHKKVVDNFSIEKMVKNYEKHYLKIIGDKNHENFTS